MGFPNPYIQDVLPLAFSDTPYRECCVSGRWVYLVANLVNISHKPEKEYILQYYREAIKELKVKLTNWEARPRLRREWEGIQVFRTIISLEPMLIPRRKSE
jgi:hypothetical protein